MKLANGCRVTDGFNGGVVLQTHGEYSWVLFDHNRQEPSTCLNMTLSLIKSSVPPRKDHFTPLMGGVGIAGEDSND